MTGHTLLNSWPASTGAACSSGARLFSAKGNAACTDASVFHQRVGLLLVCEKSQSLSSTFAMRRCHRSLPNCLRPLIIATNKDALSSSFDVASAAVLAAISDADSKAQLSAERASSSQRTDSWSAHAARSREAAASSGLFAPAPAPSATTSDTPVAKKRAVSATAAAAAVAPMRASPSPAAAGATAGCAAAASTAGGSEEPSPTASRRLPRRPRGLRGAAPDTHANTAARKRSRGVHIS